MNTRTGGVERQLANRDAHAARALVAQPQYPFAVADDDHLDPVIGGVGQNIADAVPVGIAQEQATRSPPDLAEPLAPFAHRRRIDQRQQLLQIARNQRVKQHLVRVLQLAQERIAVERIGLATQRCESPRDL